MPRTVQPTPELLARLRRQDGVATVEQLIEGGFSRRAIDNRVERTVWRRLLPGVVLTTSAHATRRQLLVAAWLWGGPGSAIDGADACAWYGLAPRDMDGRRVHVVAPTRARARSHDFVRVRRASAEIRVGAHDVVPYVDVATAFVVAARNARSHREAVATLSRGLQTGLVTIGSLRAAREQIGDKWCRGVDVALVAVGVGLRSPAEKDNRDLIGTSRVLPEPKWNQWLDLGDGGPLVCADALWTDAGFVEEVNGKRYHAWGEQFESTEARRARLVAAGLVVQGCTPTQLRRDGARVLERLERTYLRHAGLGMPAGVRLVPPPPIAG